MAKRNRRGSQEQHGKSRRDGFIEDVALAEAARSRYLNYALSVITSRALPDVRDGLKPVQRRILYAMWSDLHLSADSRYIKSAAVVGEVMKTYHPHGDQSIYDALVRMAQPFSLRHPVVEGYGNFGSIDGDPPAAMRYTECRLTPIAQALLSELRDQTVNLRPNYSSTAFEPEVLPAQFPNLLVNGASGIAVGMATNIPPHNLKEVCTALVALLDNRELPLDRLLKHIHGPDFPTGGRDSQLGRRDPPDLRHRARFDQAAGNLRAASRSPQRGADHVDSLRNRKGRARRANRRADRQGAGTATGQRQGPEHRRHPDRARAPAGLEPRRRARLPVQEHAVTSQLQRQPDLPATGRGRRGRCPQPARPDVDSPALPRLPHGSGGPTPAVRAQEPARANPYPRGLRDRLQEP